MSHLIIHQLYHSYDQLPVLLHIINVLHMVLMQYLIMQSMMPHLIYQLHHRIMLLVLIIMTMIIWFEIIILMASKLLEII